MKEKEHRLLTLLVQNHDQYTTSKALSNELLLSEKTVRTYIHKLKQVVIKHGAEIIAKQGYGFRLHITQNLSFQVFMNKNKINRTACDDMLVDTGMDRQIFILNKMLIENEHIFYESLANTLFISLSTLRKEMNAIKVLLRPYALDIVSKSKHGSWVVGEEANKRAFIIHYFFTSSRFYSLQECMRNISFFDDISVEKFIMIIIDECQKNQIKLSDVMLQNILLHLLLSIKRIEKGLSLHSFPFDDNLINSVQFSTAKQIMQRIEKEFNIQYPSSEILYLALHLGAKNNHSLTSHSPSMDHVEQELNSVLFHMEKETGILFSKDLQLKKSLLEHLFPLFLRVEHHIKMENPLTTKILCEYTDIYTLTKKYFSTMSALQNKEVSDDEWAYIALHFMAALEKQRDVHKLKVLVICSTGFGSAQLLKARIEKVFGEYMQVVNTLGYFEICDEVMEGIDLIISSVDLQTVLFPIPVIHVSVFLNENDKHEIRSFIAAFSNEKCSPIQDREKISSAKQHEKIFDQFICTNYFQIIHNKMNQKQLLKLLLNMLAKQEKSNYVEHMLQQIQLRSNLGSVVFSETVAVPHPAIPIGNKTCIGVAIIPDGLQWNDTYSHIQFVFLLSPSCMDNLELKYMIQAVIRFIERVDLQAEVIKNPTFKQFKKMFLHVM